MSDSSSRPGPVGSLLRLTGYRRLLGAFAVRVALGIGAVVAGGVANVLTRWDVVDLVRLILGGAGVMVAAGILAVGGRLNVDPDTF